MNKIKCPVCGASIKGKYCKKCGYYPKKPSFPIDMEKINISDFQKATIQHQKKKKRRKDPFVLVIIVIMCSISLLLFTYRFVTNSRYMDRDYIEEIKDSSADSEEDSLKKESEEVTDDTKNIKTTEELETNNEEEISFKGVIYKKESDKSQEYLVLVKCNSNEKEVFVESRIDGIAVREIGEEAFRDCMHLEEIYIPEGIEKIRRDAFQNCQKLKKAFLPESLCEIDESSFKDSTSLSINAISKTYASDFAQKYKIKWEERCPE